MWQDPIVLEIHKNREKHAQKFNFDLEKIYNDIKKLEKENQRKLASLPIQRHTVAEMNHE